MGAGSGDFSLLRVSGSDVRSKSAGVGEHTCNASSQKLCRTVRSSRLAWEKYCQKGRKKANTRRPPRKLIPTKDGEHLAESIECWKRRGDTGSDRRVRMKREIRSVTDISVPGYKLAISLLDREAHRLSWKEISKC